MSTDHTTIAVINSVTVKGYGSNGGLLLKRHAEPLKDGDAIDAFMEVECCHTIISSRGERWDRVNGIWENIA